MINGIDPQTADKHALFLWVVIKERDWDIFGALTQNLQKLSARSTHTVNHHGLFAPIKAAGNPFPESKSHAAN